MCAGYNVNSICCAQCQKRAPLKSRARPTCKRVLREEHRHCSERGRGGIAAALLFVYKKYLDTPIYESMIVPLQPLHDPDST